MCSHKIYSEGEAGVVILLENRVSTRRKRCRLMARERRVTQIYYCHLYNT